MYKEIVFMQGENAEKPLKILNTKGKKAVVKYLEQWDCNEGENVKEIGTGVFDVIEKIDKYILTYNEQLGHIGLLRELP